MCQLSLHRIKAIQTFLLGFCRWRIPRSCLPFIRLSRAVGNAIPYIHGVVNMLFVFICECRSLRKCLLFNLLRRFIQNNHFRWFRQCEYDDEGKECAYGQHGHSGTGERLIPLSHCTGSVVALLLRSVSALVRVPALTLLGSGANRCLAGRARHRLNRLRTPSTAGTKPVVIPLFQYRVTERVESHINLAGFLLCLPPKCGPMVEAVRMPDLQ